MTPEELELELEEVSPCPSSGEIKIVGRIRGFSREKISQLCSKEEIQCKEILGKKIAKKEDDFGRKVLIAEDGEVTLLGFEELKDALSSLRRMLGLESGGSR